MATSRNDIEARIRWRKIQEEMGIEASERKDEKMLKEADRKYSIESLKSTEHFEDEGK